MQILCKDYSLCNIISLGQQLKFFKHAENDSTTNLKKVVDKTTRKKSKYLSNETILKVDHLGNPMQRLKPLQNNQFGSTFKIHKKTRKMIQQLIQKSFVKKTARKNTK